MSLRHPKVTAWEARLKRVFDRIDDILEDKYHGAYRLNPIRPKRGTTSNKEADGLFNVGAAFSAGFGSEKGPGYVVDVRMATRDRVPFEDRRKIEDEVAALLGALLHTEFPHGDLEVSRDGHVWKIHGDLGLDSKHGLISGRKSD